MEMCICGFVVQRYDKSTYGFRIFRHLSCSVCIILTYSLENAEEDMLMDSICFLFFIHAYNQLIRARKRQPPILAYPFVLQSALFLCFSF